MPLHTEKNQLPSVVVRATTNFNQGDEHLPLGTVTCLLVTVNNYCYIQRQMHAPQEAGAFAPVSLPFEPLNNANDYSF